MKIAVWHNLPSGGAKRALYYHVRGLVHRGHGLECWSLSTADHSYLPLQELITEHVIPFEWEPKYPLRNRIGRSAIGSSINSYINAMEHMRAFDNACKQCAQEIESGEFELLLATSSVIYYMPFIMRHLQIPKVLYLQEPFRPLYEANPKLAWVANLGDNHRLRSYLHFNQSVPDFLELQALRIQAKEEWVNAHSCDTILVNSYYSRESVLRTYGCDAKVCYLGVDTSTFRHLHKKRERFIVGLGSFDRIKGVDLAIKSISLLREPRPPLIWVANSGETAYIEEMTKLAQSVGVELEIKMRLSDVELVDTLNRAALMLYTSHLEPFGLSPLEAGACATPVVAVAEGGVRETVKDGVNGLLVDRAPESIARAICKLLHDPISARRMGENAVAHVQQEWSVERSVDRVEAYLLQALSTPSAHGLMEARLK